jgi:hypothetical protein
VFDLVFLLLGAIGFSEVWVIVQDIPTLITGQLDALIDLEVHLGILYSLQL